jgi:hypothetical protein
MSLNRGANPLVGLAAMLIANLLLCGYRLYQLENCPSSDKPDIAFVAFLLALNLTLATLVIAPLGPRDKETKGLLVMLD